MNKENKVYSEILKCTSFALGKSDCVKNKDSENKLIINNGKIYIFV